MIVRDLPQEINLTKLKVRLPAKALQAFLDYGGGSEEMWIVGHYMGDFFMSTESPLNTESRQLFPFPHHVISTSNILDWEIVENLNVNDTVQPS